MARMAAPAPQPAPQPTPQPRAQPIYNEAELATLTQFSKDWPDLAAAMQLMLRGGLTVNNQQIYDQMSRVLTPALTNVEAVADSQQLSDLRRLIPDYEQVRDPVIQWVHEAPMPDYLRRAYVSVIESGEANEVADLVSRWKTATGAKTPQPTPTKPANELSEAAKQAAQTLAPVISQRTAHIEAEPQGFDDAFEAAAKMFAVPA